MEFKWMRPRMKPDSPGEIQDLSGAATRVLEALVSKHHYGSYDLRRHTNHPCTPCPPSLASNFASRVPQCSTSGLNQDICPRPAVPFFDSIMAVRQPLYDSDLPVEVSFKTADFTLPRSPTMSEEGSEPERHTGAVDGVAVCEDFDSNNALYIPNASYCAANPCEDFESSANISCYSNSFEVTMEDSSALLNVSNPVSPIRNSPCRVSSESLHRNSSMNEEQHFYFEDKKSTSIQTPQNSQSSQSWNMLEEIDNLNEISISFAQVSGKLGSSLNISSFSSQDEFMKECLSPQKNEDHISCSDSSKLITDDCILHEGLASKTREEVCHVQPTHDTPHIGNQNLTSETAVKKKFLGTPFKRALTSSSRDCQKNNSSRIPHTSTPKENTNKENEEPPPFQLCGHKIQIECAFPQRETQSTTVDQAKGSRCCQEQESLSSVVIKSLPVVSPDVDISCQSKLKNSNKRDTPADEKSSSRKRPKFLVPFKKKENAPCTLFQKLDQGMPTEFSRKNKFPPALTEKEANEVQEKICKYPPQEIALTILYKGGYSQLNRPKVEQSIFPENLVLLIVWPTSTENIILSLKRFPWSVNFLQMVFSNKCRKICFEAQALIQLLVDKFGFHTNEVSSSWLLLDPLIGCWLLNSDEPPHSFREVLSFLNLSEDGCHEVQEWLKKLCESAEVMYKNLIKRGLWQLFLHVEMRITPLLACMELHGIQVNVEKLREMEKILKNQMETLQEKAYEAAGKQFQLTSPQQLGSILYDHLKLDEKNNIVVKQTERKHNKSTSESVLIKFKDLHPLPGIILEFRSMHKLKSTYIDAVLSHISSRCIYTTWDQIAAATGRITSNEPNLQAIPKQPLMPELVLRSAFEAREGYSFLAADFQHIELRVFAHLSKDRDLIKALSQPTDVFLVLSQKWLELPSIEMVTESDREKTKRIVYALMYGAGATKLADFLHIDCNQATKILQKFSCKGSFPKIKDFTKSTVQKCRKLGYLATESGRQRLFPQINSSNFQQRMHCERQAVNFLIQGTAADLCKCAMVHTQRQIAVFKTHQNLSIRLLLQIHDELLWEVPDQHLVNVTEIVKDAMEGATSVLQSLSGFSVPLPVIMKVGKTWGNMEVVRRVSIGSASQKS